MTPLQFETQHQAEWLELEGMLARLLGRRKARGGERISGVRLAMLYRRCCEQLALARSRAYPAYLLDRLERLTADAHQVIYQRRDFGLRRLQRMIAVDFPRAVRAQARYIWLSTALLAVPTLVVGWLVYTRPELILSVVSADTAGSFEQMYSKSAESIGRDRGASNDWYMFGNYISHNISIAFQCFAGGLFAGFGSVVFLVYNGAVFGAVAGFLTDKGLADTFYPFVVTHSAFELTAIVLAGACGLRIGHALLAPGRQRRLDSLIAACRECALILYGVTVMLLVAAAVEAFWSSASWLPQAVKYPVAAVCWLAVLAYLGLQGRNAD
jgi:uncharacterized membrane protein SpoIIM required for sporulation